MLVYGKQVSLIIIVTYCMVNLLRQIMLSEVGGFTICKADEIHRDSGIVTDPTPPAKLETMNFGFASVVSFN